MRVLVTGPESSGTSLVSRIFRAAGADVAHRSATYRNDWADLPALAAACDETVVVYRDPMATLRSGVRQGLYYADALDRLHDGYRNIADLFTLRRVRVWCVTYEQLVLDQDSIRPLLYILGLDGGVEFELVTNQNAQHAQ